MKRAERDAGSISMSALAILVFMAAVAAGGALVLRASLSYGRRSRDREEARSALEKEAERVMEALTADDTPEADCPSDAVWDAVKVPQTEGVEIALEDVSSRINPNWAQKAVFQKTHLGNILLSTDPDADALQQRREDKGFSLDVKAHYGDLIKEEALSKYFSAYGYANLNVTDEFALRKLWAVRMGTETGAEAFHGRVQQLLAAKKVLKPSEVRTFLAGEYDKLFPVMNAEPVFNVHFIEPLLLTEFLSYPDWKIKHPAQTAELILGSRDSSELTGPELRKIIGAEENNRIYQYLGPTTWFWKITVTRGNARLEWIVARLPAEDEGAPRFLLTEERFSS